LYIAAVTKAERTRQFIVEQTAPLFNKKGFEGTSLQELTAATGLTKGALYGNFRDKEEISMEAFRYSIAIVKTMVAERLSGVNSFAGQIEALLDFYAEYIFNPPVPGGCPLLNRAIETDDIPSPIRKVVLMELIDTVDFIDGLLQGGVKAGEFKTTIDTRKLAYIFFCSVEGALMFARMERSKEPMDIVVGHCKNILKDIRNKRTYATKKSSGNRAGGANTSRKHHR
jgi:TetR/AcrR family transcriptional regulator, transcriptional repressor for nem operon